MKSFIGDESIYKNMISIVETTFSIVEHNAVEIVLIAFYALYRNI